MPLQSTALEASAKSAAKPRRPDWAESFHEDWFSAVPRIVISSIKDRIWSSEGGLLEKSTVLFAQMISCNQSAIRNGGTIQQGIHSICFKAKCCASATSMDFRSAQRMVSRSVTFFAPVILKILGTQTEYSEVRIDHCLGETIEAISS